MSSSLSMALTRRGVSWTLFSLTCPDDAKAKLKRLANQVQIRTSQQIHPTSLFSSSLSDPRAATQQNCTQVGPCFAAQIGLGLRQYGKSTSDTPEHRRRRTDEKRRFAFASQCCASFCNIYQLGPNNFI